VKPKPAHLGQRYGAQFEDESSRATTARCEQRVADYVESFHTRNGFSRERMTPKAARAFDAALLDMMRPWSASGFVRGETRTSVVWGVPSGGSHAG